jgi:hypothetical protein
MPQYSLAADVNRCAASLRWNPNDWLQLLEIYGVTAEMFLQRLTNILPHHMGIRDLFFIRLAATSNELSDITMTKELHLSGQQSPYRTEVGEHYCRRWVSVKVMREGCKNGGTTLMLSQISHYHNTNRSYLCLSMAKTTPGQPPASITVGILMSDTMERRFTFLSDPDLPRVTVGATCETCSLNDCSERVAPPLSLQEQQQQQSIYEALQRLN